MRIQLSERAVADLHAISSYLKMRSLQGTRSVRAAILAELSFLADFPMVGRRQSQPGVRKIVTRKHPYFIYYKFDEAAQTVFVLTIRHASREREFDDA